MAGIMAHGFGIEVNEELVRQARLVPIVHDLIGVVATGIRSGSLAALPSLRQKWLPSPFSTPLFSKTCRRKHLQYHARDVDWIF